MFSVEARDLMTCGPCTASHLETLLTGVLSLRSADEHSGGGYRRLNAMLHRPALSIILRFTLLTTLPVPVNLW